MLARSTCRHVRLKALNVLNVPLPLKIAPNILRTRYFLTIILKPDPFAGTKVVLTTMSFLQNWVILKWNLDFWHYQQTSTKLWIFKSVNNKHERTPKNCFKHLNTGKKCSMTFTVRFAELKHVWIFRYIDKKVRVGK